MDLPKRINLVYKEQPAKTKKNVISMSEYKLLNPIGYIKLMSQLSKSKIK